MQPEQEIIFQLDTSYMLLGSGAALHQQYHWYSGNVRAWLRSSSRGFEPQCAKQQSISRARLSLP
jgi:hypothetical protein